MISPHEYAVELFNKSAIDEYTIDKLIDDYQVDDSVIGFHCQQAAEKLLKAVLAERNVVFRRTHNLTYLMRLVSNTGTAVPTELGELDMLNPFAVALRYETLDTVMSFDRSETRRLIRHLHDWVETQVQP